MIPNSSDISISNNSLIGSTDEPSDECAYDFHPDILAKFILITLLGSLISVIGLCNNSLLLYVLTRSSLFRTHVFYLCILAGCDLVTETSYIAVMSMQILFDYTHDIDLYRAWHNYVKWIFTATNIGLTVSAYMIVSASAERFLSTLKWLKRRSCTGRDRWLVALGVFTFSLFSKGTVFWEMDVEYRQNCTGFGEYSLEPSALIKDFTYRTGYAVWFRHIVHVFLPFVLLLLLNGTVLLHLKRNPMEMHSALISLTLGDLVRQRKKSIRAATLMLGAIVTTYLVSNLLNVVISIWEHVDPDSLRSLSDGKFYTFSSDVISLLTIVTGCIRLPIYCACNKQLRKEILRLLRKWRRGIDSICGSYKRLFVKAKSKPKENELWENGNLGERMSNHHRFYSMRIDYNEQKALINNGHAQFTCMTGSVIV